MKSQTIRKSLQTLLRRSSSLLLSSSSSPKSLLHYKPVNLINPFLKPSILPHKLLFQSPQLNFSPFYAQSLCCFSTSKYSEDSDEYEIENDPTFEWEEEEDGEPEIGDGGAGGGIMLQNVAWGEKVLSIAREVLLKFGDDIKLYAFKTTPRGYIYVRLDQLSHEHGCPSLELLESYSREYKKVLEEQGSKGEIPDDLGLEVSSPGANRIVSVPDDLLRFKDFPMQVTYVESDTEAKLETKCGIFLLDSLDAESEHCDWKLADVKANRDPASKGRPMSRKRKDWRLRLSFPMLKKARLYIEH